MKRDETFFLGIKPDVKLPYHICTHEDWEILKCRFFSPFSWKRHGSAIIHKYINMYIILFILPRNFIFTIAVIPTVHNQRRLNNNYHVKTKRLLINN